jgi:serine/threonine-protein kinase RsbW
MDKSLFQKELIITSSLEGFDECLTLVDEIDKLLNFNIDESFGLKTVMMEALENAFIHGNKGVKELEVRVFISISISEIFIEVEDTGEGYDFSSISSPVEGSNIHNESGRGIFFIKSLCSSCYTVGKGNIIRAILKR